MSLKIDHKRSLSEMNLKPKSERKTLTSSVNSNSNFKKSIKKLSLTPAKKNILNEKEQKVINERKSMEIKKKSMMKGSFINNPFLKKGSIKKTEYLIHDDTAFSSKKSERNSNTNTNSNINNQPISHRLNNKQNYFPVDVGINDLANFSIDRLKKMSEVLMKKNADSRSNLTALSHREKKPNLEEKLTSSTGSKVSLLLNSQSRLKQSFTPPPQKKNSVKEKERDPSHHRNSKSNHNLLISETGNKM